MVSVVTMAGPTHKFLAESYVGVLGVVEQDGVAVAGMEGPELIGKQVDPEGV